MAIEPIAVELTPPPDPFLVARRLAHLRGLIWFDSAGGPADLARYSYISAAPFEWLELRAGCGEDPFDVLRRSLSRYRVSTLSGVPPFQGGAAGLFSYELCHWLERLPRSRIDEFQIPDMAIGLYDWVVGWDHRDQRCWLISTGIPSKRDSISRARTAARLEELKRLFQEDQPSSVREVHESASPAGRHPLPGFHGIFSNFSRHGFLTAIARAIEYTHAGDCFQVNLAQRLITPFRSDPLVLHSRLRTVNPAPFAAYFDLGSFQIASSSPERFLQMSREGAITTRPIKGTRPRLADPGRNEEEIAALLHSPKDRAENVMIVDLLRNDLGRVCEFGSVRVTDLCRLETYPTVHHLVSEVRGQIRPGLGAVDLLRAAFPGGSVTGAPKVRAMEIIAELEPNARGAYCGSLGWIGFDGAMDTNILIRTFTAGGGWLQFPVGGGIVADSVPEREYDETLHKAAGLLRALGMEGR
jgi:para-aminobenzoate synthetase component 1